MLATRSPDGADLVADRVVRLPSPLHPCVSPRPRSKPIAVHLDRYLSVDEYRRLCVCVWEWSCKGFAYVGHAVVGHGDGIGDVSSRRREIGSS